MPSRTEPCLSLLPRIEIENENIVMGNHRAWPTHRGFWPDTQAGLIPVTVLLKEALNLCEQSLGPPWRNQFAMTFPTECHPCPSWIPPGQTHGDFTRRGGCSIPDELTGIRRWWPSESALGNGTDASIWDIVYVKPRGSRKHEHPVIGLELESINHRLGSGGAPLCPDWLGRWGSSDLPLGSKSILLKYRRPR